MQFFGDLLNVRLIMSLSSQSSQALRRRAPRRRQTERSAVTQITAAIDPDVELPPHNYGRISLFIAFQSCAADYPSGPTAHRPKCAGTTTSTRTAVEQSTCRAATGLYHPLRVYNSQVLLITSVHGVRVTQNPTWLLYACTPDLLG